MLPRLLALFILIAMGCQTNPMVCPSPEVVKLRKTKAHRMQYMSAKRKEAMANNHNYFQESAYKAKELKKIEQWDCPKAGLKHDRMVQKKSKDLQRRYAKNLKKVAKESEERAATVYSNQEE